MSVITTFPFTTPANYTLNKAVVDNGTGKLAFKDLSPLQFLQNFNGIAGFNFDANKVDAGQALANATFFAAYDDSINGNYGNGVLTGTPTGANRPVLRCANLTGSVNSFIDYAALDNANFTQKGTVRFTFLPGYTGTPSASRPLFLIRFSVADSKNTVSISHKSSDGKILLQVRDSVSTLVINVTINGVYSPVTGVPDEFELNLDGDAGAHRLFINGVQLGVTDTTTYTRSNTAGLLRVGADTVGHCDGCIRNFIVFDEIQHTANYTPGVFITRIPGEYSQINMLPVRTHFYANFAIDKDLTWSAGSPTTTLVGSATVSGGKLTSPSTNDSYLDIPGGDNLPDTNEGAVRFIHTPNYTGGPSTTRHLFAMASAVDSSNSLVRIQHVTSALIRMDILDSAGGTILISQTGNVYSPTSGVPNEIEVNWNANTGVVHLFINGVLINGAQAGTPGTIGTRAVCRIGKDVVSSTLPGADSDFDDILLFDAVQHTVNYTAGAAIEQNTYTQAAIDLPNFNYTGVGVVQALTNLATTQVAVPKYTIEGLFWNGSIWAASDGTYAQASDKATVNTNLGALSLTAQTVISIQVVLPDGPTNNTISDMDITYTGQQFESEGTLLTNSSFVAEELLSFIATEIKPANTDVKYILRIGGVDKYHDGANWVNSDGTNSQANTLAEVQANVATLLTVNSLVAIKTVLTTSAPLTDTSEIDIITVIYDFGALVPGLPTQCQVFGFLRDSENIPLENAKVTVQPNRPPDEYVEASDRIISTVSEQTSDDQGFFVFNLIISDEFEVEGAQKMRYVLAITPENAQLPIFKNGKDNQGVAKTILFEVPNQASVNITDQIGAV